MKPADGGLIRYRENVVCPECEGSGQIIHSNSIEICKICLGGGSLYVRKKGRKASGLAIESLALREIVANFSTKMLKMERDMEMFDVHKKMTDYRLYQILQVMNKILNMDKIEGVTAQQSSFARLQKCISHYIDQPVWDSIHNIDSEYMDMLKKIEDTSNDVERLNAVHELMNKRV